MQRIILLLIFICILLFWKIAESQVTYDVCIPTSWVGGGSGEFTLTNTTGSIISAGSSLEIDWPGIVSISPWSGFTVSGSNPFILTFTNAIPQGGTTGPLGFGFTNSGPYFSPGMGILNANQPALLADPPCYVPPSYQNFDCQTSISELCFHSTSTNGNPGEIQLGEGSVFTWNANLDAYIPTNRKNWAIGMAVAHAMFTNLIGADVMSINEYFATGIQETNCGCDGGITAPAWVSDPYPDHENNNPVYCYDYTHGVAAGFFQEEYGTGWLELLQDVPCFIPTFDFDSTIVGKNFSTQLIGKVYHDYNNMMFLQYIMCFDIVGFMENCADPYGPEKLIAAIYNRGMNAGFIEDMLVTNRTAALASPDLLTFIPGLGQQYAEQISRVTAVLDNNFANVSTYGTTTYGIPWAGSHTHNGFYDEQISWTDISEYLDELVIMFTGVGVDMNLIKSNAQTKFNSINGGGSISYRYDLGTVIDAIILTLPVFEPMSGLGQAYGNSGGNACLFPTASMNESTEICEGEFVNLQVYLTGQSPWDFTYNYNGVETTVTNVTSSPYQLPVSDTGLYYLTYVEDNSALVGEVMCDSIIVSFIDTCTPLVLPVELLDFQATAIQNQVVLTEWITASEINNDYFSIERSQDAINWQQAGTMNGVGNSNELMNYSFVDWEPHDDLSYYRLRQFDVNGDIQISDIRAVYVELNNYTIYPNPTTGLLYVKGIDIDTKQLSITNLLGQTIIDQIEIIDSSPRSLTIDIASLTNGVYVLTIGKMSYKICKI
ncbi:MAG: T9SS type A sorting domain-containing protein [Crocinitomicaceae bacterium]|nr:T9SS type A sorting domain-containing protein [Crocinitomicaceae bacterium]